MFCEFELCDPTVMACVCIKRYGRLISAAITFLWSERIDRQLQDDGSLCAA
jgi:hypothetical protein